MSITIEGPPNPKTYEILPLRKACKVPVIRWLHKECHRKAKRTHEHALTGSIVHVYIIPQIVDVLVGRDSNESGKCVPVKGRRRVRAVSRALKRPIGGFQQDTLLRVHATRFPGRRLKERIVECCRILEEVALGDVHGPAALTSAPDIRRDIKPMCWYLDMAFSEHTYMKQLNDLTCSTVLRPSSKRAHKLSRFGAPGRSAAIPTIAMGLHGEQLEGPAEL